MKKYAALAAVAVMLGAGGCAMTSPAQTAWTPTPASHQDAPTVAAEQVDLVGHVRAHWIGDDVPTDHWIETTALLACKHLGGDTTFGLDADNKIDDWNYTLVITSASKFVCPVD